MYILSIFLLLGVVSGQTREGDSCVEGYTNTVGVCTNAEKCRSAKEDFQKNGINPTFCKYSQFGVTIVCCRDNTNILNTAPPAKDDGPPIWGSSNTNGPDNRRVSERKCEQYSRGVTERVDFIPLLPNPETMTISSAKCDYAGVELIVGGENANQGEFPHMAAIGFTNFENGYSFSCGGSLVSARFVLTAAHCTRDASARDPEPVVVRLGDQNIDPTVSDGAEPVDVAIRKIHKHPDYKPPKRYNDVALLELATAVEFQAAIRPACLWTRPGFGGHTKALATGWGVVDTVTQQSSKELQKVSLSLLENSVCGPLLGDIRNWDGFVDSQMCAGELRGGRDTCQGDSGSPLQIASKENQCIFYVIGVTSFGKKCAQSGQPAIYSRVSSFLDWIESVVWPGE
ncbi:serine protease snake-like [Plodia interpunctella]|uniref:serine protease snake-like n=1 Tax=Plodia interpunctella TaxID=58824 RepID=UPI002367DF8E|nr:serine protease snake-like [Plodia interpunctella]